MLEYRKIWLGLLMTLISLSARGQFSVSQNDASSLKWMSIENRYFKVIYPQGCDSLAKVYLLQLDKYRPKVAGSLGMAIGEGYRKSVPVLLHTRNFNSNGAVTWTPARMEFNTIPEWTDPSAMPWTDMLAVHEGRHAAQMQNGYRKVFGGLFYVFGQIIPGVACAYPGRLFLEGDAVIAETGLSNSGRGRSAAFLDTYYYCFDKGEWRNWMKWRNGSYYRNTPDNYAFGYLILSGIRTEFDAPDFMSDYFYRISRHPLDFWPFRHILRGTSGMRFKDSYPAILARHYQEWVKAADQRGEFMPSAAALPSTRRLTSYGNANSISSGSYLWVKKDIYHTPVLCELEASSEAGHNSVKPLLRVGNNIGRINVLTDSSLVWSQVRPHPRWGQETKSVVCRYDLNSHRKRILSGKGSLINPTGAGDGRIVATEYLWTGGCRLDFISSEDGTMLECWSVPDSLQPVQTAYYEPYVYTAAISESGYGIWRTDGKRWENVLSPSPVQIAGLICQDGRLRFTSDRNGESEYYEYDLSDGTLVQLSNTRHGGTAYAMDSDGNLCFATPGDNGTELRLTHKEELYRRVVRWEDYYRNPIADTISAQERRLAVAESPAKDSIGEPRRYKKGLHGFRVHSWAPAYVNIDAVSSLSVENVRNVAGLGAMAFFQNTMSTVDGYAGYKAMPDNSGKWFHSGHLNINYRGLYPVFELKANVNDRNKMTYRHNAAGDTVFVKITDAPSVNATLKTYVPLAWDNGVQRFGLIPTAGVMYGNDIFDKRICLLFNAGVRGYVMEHTAPSAVYPRFGIGAEAGWAHPLAYAYLYGYLPGICCGQGIKLTAAYQKTVAESPFRGNSVNLMPRGFGAYPVAYYDGCKFTLDYAAPFYMGDWHLWDMLYCSRGIVTPFVDFSLGLADVPDIHKPFSLMSAGLDFEMEFATFFWARTPVRCGVRYYYNGGSGWKTVVGTSPASKRPGISLEGFGKYGHHGLSFLFSIEI